MATVLTAPETVQSTELYRKTLGCLIGGIVGDAMGTPCEGKTYQQIGDALGRHVKSVDNAIQRIRSKLRPTAYEVSRDTDELEAGGLAKSA